jgi:acetyl esterase
MIHLGRSRGRPTVELRVRLLGRITARTAAIASMDDDDIARVQRPLARNPLVDFLLGKAAPGVEIQDGTAVGSGGSRIPVRTYRPTAARGVPLPLIMNIHGGGFVVGSLEQCDWLCSNIAAKVGAVVVSLGYRPAPAHRWPTAAEDCYAAVLDVVGRASQLPADPSQLAIVGDSA